MAPMTKACTTSNTLTKDGVAVAPCNSDEVCRDAISCDVHGEANVLKHNFTKLNGAHDVGTTSTTFTKDGVAFASGKSDEVCRGRHFMRCSWGSKCFITKFYQT